MSEVLERPKNYVCRRCKSDNILADAYAQWDFGTQQWVLSNVYELHAHCNDCGDQTTPEEITP